MKEFIAELLNVRAASNEETELKVRLVNAKVPVPVIVVAFELLKKQLSKFTIL
jgi:hypothetical protein